MPIAFAPRPATPGRRIAPAVLATEALIVPRRRVLAAGLLVAFLAAACGGGTTEETTGVTGITIEAQVSWHPPEDPDPAARADLAAALRLDRPPGDQAPPVLLPGPVPEGAGIAGAASAELTVTRTLPTGILRVDVVVRRSDQSVVVSLSSGAAGDPPVCAPLLEGEWSPVTVRGLAGCSLLVPGAVSFLSWQETGAEVLAQFGPEVPLAGLLAWLDGWRPATG